MKSAYLKYVKMHDNQYLKCVSGCCFIKWHGFGIKMIGNVYSLGQNFILNVFAEINSYFRNDLTDPTEVLSEFYSLKM